MVNLVIVAHRSGGSWKLIKSDNHPTKSNYDTTKQVTDAWYVKKIAIRS